MNSWKECRFIQCMDDTEMEKPDNIIDDRIMCPKDHGKLEI